MILQVNWPIAKGRLATLKPVLAHRGALRKAVHLPSHTCCSVPEVADMTGPTAKTCPYCQYPIKAGVPTTTCGDCGIPHHTACWEYNGGCTTYGCPGRRAVQSGSSAGPPISGAIDLSNIMAEPERLPQPNQTRGQTQPLPGRGDAPPVTAAHKLAEAGGLIGAVVGFLVGLGAGGLGCIPGAIIGFVVGALIGSVLFYLLIVAATTGIGYALGAAGGPDAAIVGGWIGLIIGILIIAAGCSRKSGTK